jgi:hypothetical protein
MLFFFAESDFESLLSVDSCILYIFLPVRGGEGGASGAAAPSCRVKKGGKMSTLNFKKMFALNKFLGY